MKKVLLMIAMILTITGCDIVKEVVRATLADEQSQQQAQPTNNPNVQLQSAPVQQAQTVPAQQPTTIIVQTERPQPTQTVIVQESRQSFIPTHYIQTKTDGYVYMRAQPYTESQKIAQLFDGTDVTVLECSSDFVTRKDAAARNARGVWCRVDANGQIGYVFSEYLRAY